MASPISILESATEPKALVDASATLAASEVVSEHEQLLGYLNSLPFLLRLNTEREYDVSSPRQLRVARVMKILRDNPHAAARVTLTGLARGGEFVGENWLRQELLVRALVTQRPPSPEAIQYWDMQSQPESENCHITIDMLCENGTDESMTLLESKLADPGHAREYKVAWIRDSMLRHRNDTPLLVASERMIQGSIPEDLRLILLEALCSYSADWYPSCSKPKPPPRILAPAESQKVLRRICRHAIEHLPLGVILGASVRKTLADVGGDDPEP